MLLNILANYLFFFFCILWFRKWAVTFSNWVNKWDWLFADLNLIFWVWKIDNTMNIVCRYLGLAMLHLHNLLTMQLLLEKIIYMNTESCPQLEQSNLGLQTVFLFGELISIQSSPCISIPFNGMSPFAPAADGLEMCCALCGIGNWYFVFKSNK